MISAMKILSPRTLFFLSSLTSSSSSSSFLQISHFSTSQNFSTHPSRRYDEESRNVRVSVWWDFENCGLPSGANVFKVAHIITSAVRASGIKGPVQITAFGDMLQIARCNQEALSSTGINLTHVPSGGKNSADRSLLLDLMYWVSQNPPPAHLFLISGDRDFATVLHRLRMNNYNILLAGPENVPGVLCSAASIMWYWHSLVKEEKLTGKHINQPPDGPYGSWYGHYKVPLGDPFSVNEQQASSRTEELPEPESEPKIRPVPKFVVKQIRQILNSHPNGISITDLRSELGRSSAGLDKDLYGYKKFSRFLLSMPQILRLRFVGAGQYTVQGTSENIPEPAESQSSLSVRPVIGNGDWDITTSKLNVVEKSISGVLEKKNEDGDLTKTLMSNGSDKHITKAVDEKKLMPSSPGLNEEETSRKMQESPTPSKVDSQFASVGELDSVPEVGFFRKVWRKWFGGDDECYTSGDSSEEKSHKSPEKCFTSGDSSRKTEDEGKCVKSTSENVDPSGPVPCSSPHLKGAMDNNLTSSSEESGDSSETNAGVFNRIVKWFGILRSGSNSDESNDQSTERLGQINSLSERHELFFKDSFWTEMDSFMDTPKGSKVVIQSKSREQIAKNLQKEGPSVLKSLSETDLLHLVSLLIVEKKWVEECFSQTQPFKLVQAVKKSSRVGDPHASSGLSSIFSGNPSVSESQNLPNNKEHKDQNVPRAEVFQSANKKHLNKSRNEILADCQNLANDILKKFPEGYNVGGFRKLFLETYGYSVDVQKLGYQKVASLLQIIPGVKIESSHIIASGKTSKGNMAVSAIPNIEENDASFVAANSVRESCHKNDNSDSQWDELGPVSNKSLSRNSLESILRRKTTPDSYEPFLSGDEYTDSEEETVPEVSAKSTMNEEDSSLLQILDSWYSSKDDVNRKDNPGSVDCSTNVLESSDSSQVRGKSETRLVNNGRKQKHLKSYSFVSDPTENKRDKLIDGILGSLKKSGEQRMHG